MALPRGGSSPPSEKGARGFVATWPPMLRKEGHIKTVLEHRPWRPVRRLAPPPHLLGGLMTDVAPGRVRGGGLNLVALALLSSLIRRLRYDSLCLLLLSWLVLLGQSVVARLLKRAKSSMLNTRKIFKHFIQPPHAKGGV